MKKVLFFLSGMLIFSSFALANENSIDQSIQNIEAEYQQLLMKEAEKVEEFKAEKTQLEEELVALKERAANKELKLAKLEKDSQIRWHRDKYKKLLKNYEAYYTKLENKIADTEQKIAELTSLLAVMQ